MSNRYITLLKGTGRVNKHFAIDADGEIVKQQPQFLSTYIGKTVAVPDQAAMEKVLLRIGQREDLVLVLGYVPDMIGGEEFLIKSIKGMKGAELGSVGKDGKKLYTRTKGVFTISDWLLVDYDINSSTPAALHFDSVEMVEHALEGKLKGVNNWIRIGSNSSRVLDGQGQHFYVLTDGEQSRERMITRMRCVDDEWGYQYGKKAWNIFDRSVYTPERIVFEGKPSVAECDADGVVLDDYEQLEVRDMEMSIKAGGAWRVAVEALEYVNVGGVKAVAGEAVESGEALHEDQVFIRVDTGEEITFKEFADSDEEKIRVQTPFRDSSSGAAFLNRFQSGDPFFFDVGEQIKHPMVMDVTDLFDVIGESSKVEKLDEIDGLVARVRAASGRLELEGDIAEDIRTTKVSEIDRGILVRELQVKFKEITGAPLKINLAREMLTPQADDISIKKPAWCEDWAYLTHDAKYVNLDTLSACSAQSFNVINGKEVPWTEGGTKPSAVKWTDSFGFIDHCLTRNYLPQCKDLICINHNGDRVINSYRHDNVPKPTKINKKQIARIEAHFKMMFADPEERHIFTQWLAWQVQHTGVILRWTPLIQSFEGMGKSYFGELLRAVLGNSNVGIVSNDSLKSGFTSWATGSAVNVMEEIKVVGHNRHDILNSVKDKITNNFVEVTFKGVDPVSMLNVTNYISFTNFKDAVPLTEHDRRFMVIVTRIQNLAEMRAYIDGSVDTYFNTLFADLKDTGSIRKWLEEYPITKAFSSMTRAPMTNAKKRMVATENSMHEGMDELDDILSGRVKIKYTNSEVASQRYVNDWYQDAVFKTVTRGNVRQLFKFKNWVMHDVPIKIDGEVLRFWTNREMTNEEIRKAVTK